MMLMAIQGFLFSPVTSLLSIKITPETCKSLNLIHPRKTLDVSCQEKNCKLSLGNSFYSFLCVYVFVCLFFLKGIERAWPKHLGFCKSYFRVCTRVNFLKTTINVDLYLQLTNTPCSANNSSQRKMKNVCFFKFVKQKHVCFIIHTLIFYFFIFVILSLTEKQQWQLHCG